jgi:exosome complex RNA-binding protein Csl4
LTEISDRNDWKDYQSLISAISANKTKEKKPNNAHNASSSFISYEEVSSLSKSLSKVENLPFKQGQLIKCRVISAASDGVIELSTRPSRINVCKLAVLFAINI